MMLIATQIILLLFALSALTKFCAEPDNFGKIIYGTFTVIFILLVYIIL